MQILLSCDCQKCSPPVQGYPVQGHPPVQSYTVF